MLQVGALALIANFETNTDETRPSDFVTLMIIIHTRLETKYVNWKLGKLSGVKRKIFLPVFQRSEEQSLAKELDIVMPNKIPRQRAPFFQNFEHRILVSPSNWLVRQPLKKIISDKSSSYLVIFPLAILANVRPKL